MSVCRGSMRFTGKPMMLRMACGFALLHALSVHAADHFAVSAEPRGTAVAVDARATLAVPYGVIWGTLTDYGRLAEFIPGMQSSRIAERRGATAFVEQHGKAGFFPFSYGIDVVVASTEESPGTIEMHAIKGNLKQLSGHYRVDSGGKDGTWVLRWIGLIEPMLPVPHFFGVPIIRDNIAEQFRGMVDEIERRALLAVKG